MGKKTTHKLLIITILLVIIALFYFVRPLHRLVSDSASLLLSMDTTKVADYIASFGVYAVLVSFFLMVFQSVIAPFPAFLITFANAAVFGWWKGAILSWASAMAGACICFGIARLLGRNTVEKLSGKKGIKSFERYFDRYGGKTILVCRLLPFVSFDFVSYGAGLTSMSFWGFVIATGLGQLPATIVYSYVGGQLTGGAQKLITGLLLVFALFFMISIIKNIYDKKHSPQ